MVSSDCRLQSWSLPAWCCGGFQYIWLLLLVAYSALWPTAFVASIPVAYSSLWPSLFVAVTAYGLQCLWRNSGVVAGNVGGFRCLWCALSWPLLPVALLSLLYTPVLAVMYGYARGMQDTDKSPNDVLAIVCNTNTVTEASCTATTQSARQVVQRRASAAWCTLCLVCIILPSCSGTHYVNSYVVKYSLDFSFFFY